MEHPFINDISSKSLEELQDAITSLNNKLTFAYRTGNSPLIHQLHMVLESYRKESSKKMDELFKKQNIQTNVNIEKES
jgi:tRNA(Ile2) C34 agmatinyltransferase TiaS